MTLILTASLGLVLLATVMAILGTRELLASAPEEDRTYKDPLPRFFKMTWPVIQLIASKVCRHLPGSLRTRIGIHLRSASLDYALSADQFLAGMFVAACVAVSVFAMGVCVPGAASWKLLPVAGLAGLMLPLLWLSEERKLRNNQILKHLPFLLDIIVLAVESGLNLTSALQRAVERLPPGPLRIEFQRMLREVRAGRSRDEAMTLLADRLAISGISNLVAALVAADKQGAELGPMLRSQADQRRTERFQRAEKLAMEAPVKMLLPLFACIFPCTFVVLAFPIVMKFLQGGFL